MVVPHASIAQPEQCCEPSVLRACVIQSSVLSTFHGTHAVQLILDTCAAPKVGSCFVCNTILVHSSNPFLPTARCSQSFLFRSQIRSFTYSSALCRSYLSVVNAFLPMWNSVLQTWVRRRINLVVSMHNGASGKKEAMRHWSHCPATA